MSFLCLFLSLSVFAAGPPGEPVESITGKALPELGIIDPNAPLNVQIAQYKARELEPQAYWGYEQIGMKPQLVHKVRQGLELIFLREYKEAREHFFDLEEEYPTVLGGMGSVASAVVWQTLMMENFDFRYDKQYRSATNQARSELNALLKIPGNEPWEHFMLAGIVGIEAIHAIRREKFIGALQLAFEAMDHIEEVRTLAPEFTDLKLADGMYNYWRTVITMASPMLPDFGDSRMKGIEQMREVEANGVFLAPTATLALVFSWFEERNMKQALNSCLKNKRSYPNNLINNMVLGQSQTYLRRYGGAFKTYDEILAVDPTNQRVHYWKGLTFLRSGKVALAKAEFEGYLKYEYIESWQIAATQYRLGQVAARQKNYNAAITAYKKSAKLGHKGGKAAHDRLKKAHKSGKLNW